MTTADKNTATAIRKWLKGQWIVRHVPFVLFLAFLAVFYIANGHYTDSTIRQIGQQQKALKQLQYTYKTQAAELMHRSKEHELAQAVKALGLKKLNAPPHTIAKPKN
jgi:hypothetical protein